LQTEVLFAKPGVILRGARPSSNRPRAMATSPAMAAIRHVRQQLGLSKRELLRLLHAGVETYRTWDSGRRVAQNQALDRVRRFLLPVACAHPSLCARDGVAGARPNVEGCSDRWTFACRIRRSFVFWSSGRESNERTRILSSVLGSADRRARSDVNARF
jgi:hypothetical protein